jgi:DNA-binding transcriptional LysR family regulator
MSQTVDLNGLENVRIEDIAKFLEVFYRATQRGVEGRTTFAGLFEGFDAHSTTVGQLMRIVQFLDAELNPASDKARKPRTSGLELLFAKRAGGDGKLEPTELAIVLHRELQIIKDTYTEVRHRVAKEIRGAGRPTEIRIGSPQSFGLRIMTAVLSGWEQTLGGNVRLSVEIANTLELLPRLNSGLLDFVIGYGATDQIGVPQDGWKVSFSSFGYGSEMVLICHPHAHLQLLNDNTLNTNVGAEADSSLPSASSSEPRREGGGSSGRGRGSRRVVSTPPDPSMPHLLETLRSVDLNDIDYGSSTLIVGNSWFQPGPLQSILDRYARNQNVKVVDSYEETLARVRMNLGFGVVPDHYASRTEIKAFRLKNPKAFVRWVGAYYSSRYPMSAKACQAVTFVRRYVERFGLHSRQNRLLTLGDDEYQQLCAEFQCQSTDWAAVAILDYPRKPNTGT